MKGLIKRILTAILALQIVVVYGRLGLKMPANIINFLAKLKPIISFDLLKIVADVINGIFTFDMTRHQELAKSALQPTLQDMGYKTFNSILNLGSLVAMLAFVMAKIMLFFLLNSAQNAGLKSRRLSKFLHSEKKTLFFT
mmetsp:Transcript_26729/g.40767  ORF Transcript_26729/g.40767 Transcript_26729/m.40767 type:complete len:140 (-) Transcript_26729:1288-1707(-)